MYRINDKWVEKFVKHLDYISNPSVVKKNYKVLKQFTSVLVTRTIEDKNLFKEIQKQVEKLKNDCYSLNDDKSSKPLPQDDSNNDK